MTNFTFRSTNAITTSGSSTSAPFRIDANTFTSGDVMLTTYGNAPGLIDHNTFTSSTTPNEMIHNEGLGANNAGGWTDDVVPGSANMLIIEDNTFTYNATGSPAYFWGSSALQSYYGSRTVFRNNTCNNVQVDQHGTAGMIGARWWEVYRNTFNTTNVNQDKYIALRAGSGVVFDNNHTGTNPGAGSISLYEEDSGYPALYQVGRGKNQSLEPAYLWNNTGGMNVSSGSSNVLVNRDYYLAKKPNYTPLVYPYPLDAGGLPVRNAGAGGDPGPSPDPNVVTLATCASQTVQAAINAASSGMRIQCPAGNWTWSSAGAVQINNKSVILQGAGVDSTVISISAAGAFNVPSTNTGAFRVTGFTFRSTSNFGTDSGFAMFTIRGGKGWRIDGNKFNIFSDRLSYDGGNAIYTVGNVAGLIDHNQFVNESTSSNCWHAATYIEGSGATAWSLPSQLGTAANAVVIEDNVITETRQCSEHNPHAAYGQKGGIYILRHNVITNANVDVHGFCATYAAREFEISNNQFIVSNSRNIYALLYIRGATGVVYGNSLTVQGSGTASNGIRMTEYRVNSPSSCSASVSLGGVQANTCCGASEGFPCISQIGRGQNQQADPMYVWSNANFPSNTLSNEGSSCSGANVSSFIQAGRDYLVGSTPKPGYSPFPYPYPLTATGMPDLAPASVVSPPSGLTATVN